MENTAELNEVAEAELQSCMNCITPHGTIFDKEDCLFGTLNVSFDHANVALPNIVILATGGTIAGTGNDTVGYEPGKLNIKFLIDSTPKIAEIANVWGIQVCNLNSDDITAKNWITLANTINSLAKRDDVDGFVITHGTDIMDETAYFLNLTVKTDKPVVITGAMRPATVISADGPMNLYESVALVGSKEAMGKGVLVCFSNGIFSGRDVQKANTILVNAYNGGNYGCLGYIIDETPYFFMESCKKHTKDTEFDVTEISDLPKVAVVYFNTETDAGVIDYYVKNGAKGIVIAGAGAGGYNLELIKKIQSLESKKIPIIRSSRIGSGMVCESPNYIGYITAAGDLPPQKAAVLLRLALTRTSDIDEISRMIKTY